MVRFRAMFLRTSLIFGQLSCTARRGLSVPQISKFFFEFINVGPDGLSLLSPDFLANFLLLHDGQQNIVIIKLIKLPNRNLENSSLQSTKPGDFDSNDHNQLLMVQSSIGCQFNRLLFDRSAEFIVQNYICDKMRKGHRRTQSACIPSSQEPQNNTKITKQNPSPNQILKLLEESEKKVESKVITYERLETSNQRQLNYLNFGHYTLQRMNGGDFQARNAAKNPSKQSKLICIPQTNKSSEISSQNPSLGPKEDDIPKLKPNRGSVFLLAKPSRHKKTNSVIQQKIGRIPGEVISKPRHH